MVDVRIDLLGPPRIRVEGAVVDLPPRQAAMLAVLALASPRAVAADVLIDRLWGDDLPTDPANALQQRVSALRRTLGSAASSLTTVPGGYRLLVEPDAVDVHRFEVAVTTSRQIEDSGTALDLLENALGLWRGSALEGLEDETWAQIEVTRLEELRRAAFEDLAAFALASGDSATAVRVLTPLVEETPIRERACGLLMRALYLEGRQADALAKYERTRLMLLEDLGVDPGPDLEAAYESILTHTVETAPRDSRPRRGRPLSGGGQVIGRDAEIESVARLLAASRLVTLTGPGGAGKTTLALAAGCALDPPPDGAWMVELAPVVASGVIDAFARAVGLTGGMGVDLGLDTLVAALADQELLLVIDNCEHVIEDVAAVVQVLLDAASRIRVLTTSREPLGLSGEVVWSVPPLSLPDPAERDAQVLLESPAMRLFVERIRDHRPEFELDERTAGDASLIVRRLDGVPLALELAAARARVLTLAEIADGLEDRFTILTSNLRAAPSRQRTLRGALDWSWELADEKTRLAWAVLSVPSGPFTLDVAESLLDGVQDTSNALDAVTALADRSVVVVDTGGERARYRMLETIREYGREQLGRLHLTQIVHEQHAAVVMSGLDACRQDDPTVFGVDLAAMTEWLDESRAVLAWSEAEERFELMARLAGRLGWLWLVRGMNSEGIGWLDRAMPNGPAAASSYDGQAVLWASGLRTRQADERASDWSRAALDHPGLGPAERATALVFDAVHRAHIGETDEGALLEAIRAGADVGAWPHGFAHLIAAQIWRLRGESNRAVDHASEAARLLAEDDRGGWARAYSLDLLIDRAVDSGRYDEARSMALEGLELCRQDVATALEARMLLQLAVIEAERGYGSDSARLLDRALELSTLAGPGPTLGYALLIAGSLTRQRGDTATARRQLDDAARMLQATNTGYGAQWAEMELAHIAASEGDIERAIDAVKDARRRGEPALLFRGLVGLAEAALEVGDIERSTAVAGAAGAMIAGGHDPSAPVLARLEAVVELVGVRPEETAELDELLGRAFAK